MKGHIMKTVQSNSKKNRKVFGRLFLVSILVLLLPDMLMQLLQSNTIQSDLLTQKIESSLSRFQYSSPLYLEFNLTVIISLITLLTASISLLGFILSCPPFVLIKEKNASSVVAQEAHKLEQILADLQLELDRRQH
jgi:hypothetical protein